jgi:hypothetical protein
MGCMISAEAAIAYIGMAKSISLATVIPTNIQEFGCGRI